MAIFGAKKRSRESTPPSSPREVEISVPAVGDKIGVNLHRPKKSTRVHSVNPASPAQDAGISKDDVLLAVNGQPVKCAFQARDLISRFILDAQADENAPPTIRLTVVPQSFKPFSDPESCRVLQSL